MLGSGGTASHILNLGTRWRRVVSFTSGHFTPKEKAPLNRRLGGGQSGLGGKEITFFPRQSDVL